MLGCELEGQVTAAGESRRPEGRGGRRGAAAVLHLEMSWLKGAGPDEHAVFPLVG